MLGRMTKPYIDVPLRLAEETTDSVAGSFERVEVYAQRIARGESNFHPGDSSHIVVQPSQLPKEAGIREVSAKRYLTSW